MDRNLWMAILLSIGVLVAWSFFFSPQTQAPVKSPSAAVQAPTPPPKATFEENDPQTPVLPMLPRPESPAPVPPTEGTPSEPEKAPEGTSARAGLHDPRNPVKPSEKSEKKAPEKSSESLPKTELAPRPTTPVEPKAERFHAIETDRFTALFSSKGGVLKSLVLKGEKFTRPIPGQENREQVDVVTSPEPENRPFALLLDQANFTYDSLGDFDVESADATGIVFSMTTPEGIVIRKIFRHIQDFSFEMKIQFQNRAAAAAAFFPKIRVVGFQSEATLHKGLFGSAPLNLMIPKSFVDGKIWEGTNLEDLEAVSDIRKGSITWAGIDDRFFLLALLPSAGPRTQVTTKAVSKVDSSLQGDKGAMKLHWVAITHAWENQRVNPGESLDLDYRLFVGPKEYEILQNAGSKLDEAVDFWVLGFLAIPMLYVLKFSYSIIPNWGIAIILLTILIKLLTHPLTKKSYQSMQKMKELKPKMDAIKTKCGDDRAEYNKQIMELYRREKVNPMGGCLPILLQMPIYIALYKMIQNAVDLYNSTFIPGWINDLTMPDPFYLMPIALGVLMFLQQKMTPTADSQQQKIMMYMMPPMMFFFMLVLPAGLVLYILANTLMSVLQQYYTNRKAEAKAAAK